ncbi:MAG: alpha-hydroxy acid oxidase [Burkholderiales bacterium]
MSYRDALNIHELQAMAKRRLPRGVYGFVAGGVEDDHALRNNRNVFERIRFRTRSPVDVSARSQEVEIFGRTFASPFGIAPMGIAGVFCFEADLALARAAATMKVPFTLSNMSTIPMETVAQSGDHARWLQAYMANNREQGAKFARRADAAGYEVLMITTDVPVQANRENNLRNGFSLPLEIGPGLLFQGLTHPRWSASVFARTVMKYGIPRLENTDRGDRPTILKQTEKDVRGRRDSVDWDFIRYMRDQWKKPLLVKGILHPADAELAVRHGLDGVVLSNHGGRQLDSAVSPIEVLPEIRAAVGKKLKLVVDSGIRRGTDILKALALGADFILCGRAAMFGVAVGGAEGATHALQLLRAEVDRDLAQLGCPSIAELNPDFLDTRDLFYGRTWAAESQAAKPLKVVV